MRERLNNNFTDVRKHIKNVVTFSLTLALALAATFLWTPITGNPMPEFWEDFCRTYSAIATVAIIRNAVDISRKKTTPPKNLGE